MSETLFQKWFRATKVAHLNYNAMRRRGLPLPPIIAIAYNSGPASAPCEGKIEFGDASGSRVEKQLVLTAAGFDLVYLAIARALHDCVADAIIKQAAGARGP